VTSSSRSESNSCAPSMVGKIMMNENGHRRLLAWNEQAGTLPVGESTTPHRTATIFSQRKVRPRNPKNDLATPASLTTTSRKTEKGHNFSYAGRASGSFRYRLFRGIRCAPHRLCRPTFESSAARPRRSSRQPGRTHHHP
jgi:hypothetical protein